ncbi:uncharacterized protein [Primulina eburnea]|uniref:uncharacterized protein n=1 Tax=Primulina eburnea TaxID=1245227 RepID=UPI003C6BF7A3
MDRILEGGHWSFDNHLLILHRLQPGEVPTQVPLNFIPFWVQIYDLPIRYISESIGTKLGDFIGQFMSYDNTNNTGFWRSYMRIRVAVDVRRPLLRCKKICKPGGDCFLVNFKYEKLGSFCFVCGALGHTERFCEKPFSSNDKDMKREWGAWMRAPDKRLSQSKTSKWLREYADLGETISDVHSGRFTDHTRMQMAEGSQSLINPETLGTSGVNLSKDCIPRKEMLDTRDTSGEYQSHNFNVEAGNINEENIGLLLTEDRKRRRANIRAEAQTNMMNIDPNTLMDPITDIPSATTHEPTFDHQNTTIDNIQSFLTAEPGHQACRQP